MPRHAIHHASRPPRHTARPSQMSPLPHPSWRHADAGGNLHGHLIDAREFWQRLGL